MIDLEPHRTTRWLTSGNLPRRPKGHCRWCGVRVKPPKRTWCSDLCVHSYRVRSDSGYVRGCIRRRDRDLLDYNTGRIVLSFALEDWPEEDGELRDELKRAAQLQDEALRTTAAWWGVPSITPFCRVHRSLWEADHVLAVEEGGGCCDLAGFETLCLRCHKDKTATHASRRAARNAQQRPLF